MFTWVLLQFVESSNAIHSERR